jgi:hypothetical protein
MDEHGKNRYAAHAFYNAAEKRTALAGEIF